MLDFEVKAMPWSDTIVADLPQRMIRLVQSTRNPTI
jgi:hypothetical protein